MFDRHNDRLIRIGVLAWLDTCDQERRKAPRIDDWLKGATSAGGYSWVGRTFDPVRGKL